MPRPIWAVGNKLRAIASLCKGPLRPDAVRTAGLQLADEALRMSARLKRAANPLSGSCSSDRPTWSRAHSELAALLVRTVWQKKRDHARIAAAGVIACRAMTRLADDQAGLPRPVGLPRQSGHIFLASNLVAGV